MALLPFFAAAPFGYVLYQDEVEWGARQVKALRFPLPFDSFQSELRDHPSQILHTPAIYAWPALSAAICGTCLAVTYRRLRRGDAAALASTGWPIAVIPILSWIAVGLLFGTLDRVIRINW